MVESPLATLPKHSEYSILSQNFYSKSILPGGKCMHNKDTFFRGREVYIEEKSMLPHRSWNTSTCLQPNFLCFQNDLKFFPGTKVKTLWISKLVFDSSNTFLKHQCLHIKYSMWMLWTFIPGVALHTSELQHSITPTKSWLSSPRLSKRFVQRARCQRKGPSSQQTVTARKGPSSFEISFLRLQLL